MFVLNDDLSIYATRGDIVFFSVQAEEDGVLHQFQPGDVVRIKIYGKKDAKNVVLQKDFPVTVATDSVEIFLEREDTKIAGVISKPVVYWYEVVLNDDTQPQTLIGYDEDGAKEFKIYPEGADLVPFLPDAEDVPFIDHELDLSSPRPVENQAVARAIVSLKAAVTEKADDALTRAKNAENAVAVQKNRIDTLIALPSGATTNDARLEDICNGADGVKYDNPGNAARGQYKHGIHNAQTAGVFAPFAMKSGAISSVTGEWYADSKRMTTTDFIKVKAGDKVYFGKNEVYDYSILFFTIGGAFVKETGWIHTEHSFDADGYIRLNFRRRDDLQMAEAEATDIATVIKVGATFPVSEEAAAIAQEIVREHLEHFGIGLKFIDITWGTFEGTSTAQTTRAVTPKHIPVEAGEKIEFKANTTYKFGYRCYDAEKTYDGIDHGWNTESQKLTANGFVKINFARIDNGALTEDDFAELRKICKIVRGGENKDGAINSISVEHGRYEGASYVFARIPKTTNNGETFVPKLHLTSDGETLGGKKISALEYAKMHNGIFTINAGLFNVTNMQPVGQTIIDGVAIVREPMVDDNGYPISATECYPLCINANGDLSAPYARNVDTAKMIADGVVTAVTGWGKIVENFQPCADTVENEIVHKGKYIRQVIGQFQNGDYCICTVDQSRGKVENEAGVTYKQLAQLLMDKGVKFAYSLDGGGSAETVIGVRQLNPVYEGTVGRSVPTVITFEC